MAGQFAGDLDFVGWSHALAVTAAADEAERTVGPAERRRILEQLAAKSGLAPTTVIRRDLAIAWLRVQSRADIAENRRLPIGVVTMIVTHRRLDDAAKVKLLDELCALVENDSAAPVRAVTERRLEELAPKPPKSDDWLRASDDWHFDSFDRRCGREHPSRLPGQTYFNLLTRFPTEGRPVVVAMAGTGTGLDACKLRGVRDYVGFDLRHDDRVAERHGGRFLVHDAIDPDWSSVCSRDAAGLVVVAPPPFAFGATAETSSPMDMGGLRDPDEYLQALQLVLHNANGVLAVDGVLAVVVRNTSEFENGTPVPNLVHRTTGIIEALGFECFLGHAVVTVDRRRARVAHEGPWLRPDVLHVVIYRKSSP